MVSTFTPNIQLEEPARGDYVGTWDTPVNSNMTLTDKVVGAISVITLNNSPVILASAQFQSRTLTFVSTLTGSVAITFPTSFTKDYEVYNICTGTSAFTITLQAAGGGQVICVPPGEIIEVRNDGTNMRFKNLGRIGSLEDYVGTAVPAWVTGCTIPPYLNCDGSAFSAVTYPALATILNGTTLPDIRGTTRYALNQGTARLTLASGGLDGDTIGSLKATPTVSIGSSNLPPYTPAGSVTGTASNAAVQLYNGLGAQSLGGGITGFGWSNAPTVSVLTYTLNAAFLGSPQGGVNYPLPAIGTGTVYGITMIRAA